MELAIKRWKSLLDVDALRARRRLGNSWSRFDGPRQASRWRGWKLIKDEVDVCIMNVQG